MQERSRLLIDHEVVVRAVEIPDRESALVAIVCLEQTGGHLQLQ